MNHRKIYKSIILFGLFFALNGCAEYTKSTGTMETPTSDAAYLYGRFSIESRRAPLGLDGYKTMGFKVECANNTSYTIRFSKESTAQVIKITPSTCSFTEIIYSDADGRIRRRKPVAASSLQHIEYAAGKAYYLGDFWAAATTKIEGAMINTT
jgi:hypothetical protein